ncbi:MAG: hypothetical protein QOI34_1659 [Verrucomicrobiota bacterium]
MSKEPRFWRNVALIGLAHVAVVVGLFHWSQATKTPTAQSVIWIDGNAGRPAAAPTNYGSVPTPVDAPSFLPEESPNPSEALEEDQPVLTSLKSDIQLPTATPTPTPKPIATPAVKAPPKPKPKPPQKPAPKPTPKPTPKPSPKKILLAKASPKPSPKIKPSPRPAEESDEDADSDTQKKPIAKAAVANHNDAGETETDPTDKPIKKAVAAHAGDGNGDSTAGNGSGGGSAGTSDVGWYGSMLHDRFYSEWVQPTTTVSSSSKISALVKIRIERDGRVSNFEIIKPSGNVMIDESVASIGKHVRQVDPLPTGLGNHGHYDVKINFELNSEQ